MRTPLMASLLFLMMSAPARAAVPAGFVETTYSSSRLTPATGMAWAPDGSGRLFVTLKNGVVRTVAMKGGVLETEAGTTTLVTSTFATEPTVHTNSECGLIGIAFDPNYVVNRYVYFFVTVSASEQRIVRYTDSNGTGIARTEVVTRLPTAGNNHDGGGLGFGPDGKLYWAIGDLGNGSGVDADLTSLAAKVGRANLDGTPVNDNPFNDGVGPNNEYIWARGLRNPFTFTFQPTTGLLWVNDVGDGYEQVLVVNRRSHAGYNDYENNQPVGNDYITPVIKYRTNGFDSRNVTATGAVRSGGVTTFTTTTPHGLRKGEKLTLEGVGDTSFNGEFYVASANNAPTTTTFTVAQPGLPDATSGGGTVTTQALGGSITGGVFYDATLFPPEYRGNYFFGDFNSAQVTRATLAADNSVATVDAWGTGFAANVDMSVGPDGALYALGYTNGVVRRVTPTATGQKLIVSGLNLRLMEGGRAAFTVRLAQAPTSAVTVNVARALGGSEDLRVAGSDTLSFTAQNWSAPRVVVLESVVDEDEDEDVATFTVASEGLTTESVVATTIDSNAARLVLSTSRLSVPEGGTATFEVSLSKRPSSNVTVTVAKTQGDPDLTVTSAAMLAFTTSNWNTPQTVTLQAAQDADTVDGTATITLALPGLDARTLEAVEADDEPLQPTISSTPITTATEGVEYRYDLEAVGRPQPTYSLEGSVPPGMSIDATTGLITWTPSAAGTVDVLVRATNGVPPDAEQAFSITTEAAQGEPDAGADAGTGTSDAGTGNPDAGTGNPLPEDDSGCGCGAAPVAPLAWLALVALATRRKRSRAS
ncbi:MULTISPECIES: PQQ-dependent sugar dehydrogenase [unclassified Corallococcus]|uniref:PQQ-dependent sugar dehydrogenase n=1 Tax=unclassified Corallococcus TaxID=2685029 RepID=UPI001A901EAA|nr:MULTISPECIES: PQQ-dependent sugar dehydrogenase [unclassified Corallococcus]MBN9683500.1 PQQ-dependent sugar dehydrogenase [Corallococcus sp. NCSPR001]WAS84983.1 PQQ-dependent sugar dehydrogenase [Corallococcus sp. NCRR]